MSQSAFRPFAEIRRNWRLIALLTILGGLVTTAAHSLQGDIFTSRASIQVTDARVLGGPLSGSGQELSRRVSSVASIIQSDTVLASAAEGLGVSKERLAASLRVQASRVSNTVTVEAHAASPGEAHRMLSSAVASTDSWLVHQERTELYRRAAALQPAIDRAAASAAGLGDTGADSAVVLDALVSTQELLRLRAGQVTSPLATLSQPSLPNMPTGDHELITLTTGAALGLGMGIFLTLFQATSMRPTWYVPDTPTGTKT
ncbi:Wzz/FepE/Etk N-terminal domain-containing protein [Blastococcus montanus]|uniref:Wzz/FepE/Etk N-terminal domain-containing protein n=1 Tax=Blastococcus montanus TaxID=3144973 RepID=UPI00320A8B20